MTARTIPSELEDLGGMLDAARVDGAVRDTGDQDIEGAKNFLKTVSTPRIDHGTQGGTVEVPALHVLWTLQPITPGTAKWGSTCGTADFNTYKDETNYNGLNPDESVPTEPRIVWGIESNYYEAASGRLTAEFYTEYRSPAVGGPSPRYQRRPFGCTIDKLTGSVSSSIETGPPFGTFGKFAIRGGASNGGDFDIATFVTGTDQATSLMLVTSPLTVQRATTLQSTLSVAGETTVSGVLNLAKSGADGAYAEVLRAQIPGNLGTQNWRNSIESTASSNASNSGWQFKCATSQTTQAVVFAVSGDGNASVAGGLSVGGGGFIKRILRSSATLSFPSIAAGSSAPLTITVTGAVAGSVAAIGTPAGIEPGLRIETPVVTSSDTVTVTLTNTTGSPISPASALYRVIVFNQ